MTGALFVSGSEWVGAGVRSIETGLHQLFTGARRRVVACTYSIGGAAFDLPEQWIAATLVRGVEIVLVVNRWDKQHPFAVAPLVHLARRDDRFALYSWDGPDRTELHAKVVVQDERIALIGSSNWSGNGFLHSHEMAVMVEGDAASTAARLITSLTGSTYARRRP